MRADSWGRWGSEDETGALNLIGSDEVLHAVGLVSEGRVIRLGQDLGPRTPVAPHRKRVERFMTRDGGDYTSGARRPGGFQFAEEVVSFAAHSGTHIDALSHAWYDDQLYNGFPSSGIRSTTGAQRCGADKLKPIVTRGVLLDVAGLRPDPWEPGETISAAHLQTAAEAADVIPATGDAVLIRTGWMTRATAEGHDYFAAEPGIDYEAAQWLVDAEVAVVGADNYAVEVQPSAAGTMFPVHQLLIRDHGIPLIEGLLLDELADARASSFLFVASPLPIVGGTAGPVCPIAVL
jgi:kynurenine formamidase